MPKTKTLVVPTHDGLPTTQYNEYNVIALKEIIGKRNIKTAIDIGGWWGPWTINMAPIAKNIICFEANPELQPGNGDIVYIENRKPIQRASDQTEDIKLIIEF